MDSYFQDGSVMHVRITVARGSCATPAAVLARAARIRVTSGRAAVGARRTSRCYGICVPPPLGSVAGFLAAAPPFPVLNCSLKS